MGQVKQWATECAENKVGCIIDDYLKEKIDFNIAKDKIMKVENVNLANVDENNVDEVLFYAKEDYWKKRNAEGKSK